MERKKKNPQKAPLWLRVVGALLGGIAVGYMFYALYHNTIPSLAMLLVGYGVKQVGQIFFPKDLLFPWIKQLLIIGAVTSLLLDIFAQVG